MWNKLTSTSAKREIWLHNECCSNVYYSLAGDNYRESITLSIEVLSLSAQGDDWRVGEGSADAGGN